MEEEIIELKVPEKDLDFFIILMHKLGYNYSIQNNNKEISQWQIEKTRERSVTPKDKYLSQEEFESKLKGL